jgi:hypothetical protein
VQEALGDFEFPATKEELVAHAEDVGEQEAVRLLLELPPATYQDIADVREAMPR